MEEEHDAAPPVRRSLYLSEGAKARKRERKSQLTSGEARKKSFVRKLERVPSSEVVDVKRLERLPSSEAVDLPAFSVPQTAAGDKNEGLFGPFIPRCMPRHRA